MKSLFSLLLSVVIVAGYSCSSKEKVDLLVYNATIYTVDSSFSTTEAMVIKDGKIIATGKRAGLEEKYEPKEKTDAGGKFIYPGFIDAHAHFVGYGLGLQTADLVGTTSWEDILHRLSEFAKSLPKDQWLIGRGWDQNDWDRKEFPSNEKLNELYPDRPVILERIDGHASIANQRALALADVKAGDKITGGEVEVKNGKLTGILIDNAVNLVSSRIPAVTDEQYKKSIQQAERNCFAVGLTTVDDCGLNAADAEAIRQLQENGDLKMRMYVMLSDVKTNYDYMEKKGPVKTARLNVRSFKVYGDGALGSRGACLLKPYSDKPGYSGFL